MSMRMFLIVSMLLVWSVSVRAQEVNGHLEGRVLDGQGTPLPEVNVTVAGSSLQGKRGAVTDERGYFRVLSLPVGVYEVGISHVAYQAIKYQEVAIRLGKTNALGEIRLREKTMDLAEMVISRERPLIDPTTAGVGGNLQASTYEALPVERNFRSMVALLPQANASYLGDEANVAGSSGLENVYYIDGINTTDPFRARTSTNLPYNFVREIEVKGGGYEAEYGRAMGGIVNVITHSGGNAFHGSAFSFLTSNALAGDARRGVLDAKVDGFSTYDAGFSLGGPIVRDRVWFFAAYDASYENRDIDVPGFGLRADEQKSNIFAGKLTWQATERTDVVFTALGDPTSHHRVGTQEFLGDPNALENIDPYLESAEEGGVNLSLNARHRVGSDLLLEAAVARYERDETRGGDSERGRNEPLFIDVATGTYSGGYGESYDLHSVRTSARLSATLFSGRHTLKAGVEYEDNLADLLWIPTLPGKIQRIGEKYDVLYGALDCEPHNRVSTMYAQDSWQVNDRLRINAGLRWDGQFLIGAADSLAQAITGQLQPRLGFVYQPGEVGEQKVYGSYGRYYQQMPLFLSSLAHVPWDNYSAYYSVDPRQNPEAEADSVTVYASTDFVGAKKLDDLEGEHLDEFSAGYERNIGEGLKVGIRGTYRVQRQIYSGGFSAAGVFVGNPGRGDLSFLPEPERTYVALELSFEKTGSPLSVSGSYVLSRLRGNYPGLYDADQRQANPGNSFALQLADQAPNSTGLLPNDRTHVFKLFGAYRFDRGITAGGFFTWQSGTPLNEFGATWLGYGRKSYLVERGAAGRTPALWELNLRLVYDLLNSGLYRVPARLILDVMHVGSRREVVDVDQVRFGALDEEGNQAFPNENFGRAMRYQPPMTLRLGLEVDFL